MKVKISARYYIDEESQRLAELKITTVIESIFNQLKNALAIEKLDTIFVPENYHDELHSFQTSIGQNKYSTRNRHSEAIGQMLTSVKDGIKEYYIYFNKQYALALAAGNLTDDIDKVFRQKYEDAVHFLIHELAHIDEEEIFDEVESKNFRSRVAESSYYWRLSRDLWREYYASRVSAELFAVTNQDITLLLKSWKYIETEVIRVRTSYNSQILSLDDFEGKLYESTRFILISFIYFIAIYSASNCFNVLGFMNQISGVPSLYLSGIIEPMANELNDLYNEFGKRKSLGFSNLEVLVRKYINHF